MITNVQKTVLKSTAKAVFQLKEKKQTLLNSITQLEAELRELDEVIDSYNANIKTVTNGYKAEDIMQIVEKETARTNKDGEPITMRSYEWIYPDTIIPTTNNTSSTTSTASPDVPTTENAKEEENKEEEIKKEVERITSLEGFDELPF